MVVTKLKKRTKCHCCDEWKEDTVYRADSFKEVAYGEIEIIPLCDECTQNGVRWGADHKIFLDRKNK